VHHRRHPAVIAVRLQMLTDMCRLCGSLSAVHIHRQCIWRVFISADLQDMDQKQFSSDCVMRESKPGCHIAGSITVEANSQSSLYCAGIVSDHTGRQDVEVGGRRHQDTRASLDGLSVQ